jgi:peptidoglycan biosynthesis protein MviN/MurJ (putative lipid II flippase)
VEEVNDFSWTTAGLILIVYILVDMLYAYYIIQVEQRNPMKAAIVSSILYSLLAYGVVSYSRNLLYLFPLATGAFIGTYLTVWWKR